MMNLLRSNGGDTNFRWYNVEVSWEGQKDSNKLSTYLVLTLLSNLKTKWNISCGLKDWGLKKLTTFVFGHFTSISGHYMANNVNIFHKSVVLMVILRG